MRIAFLSASIPFGQRDYRRADVHRDTARAVLIRDAVLAVTRAALRARMGLIFGAHPSVSPMVLAVARGVHWQEWSQQAPILVFQSRAFVEHYPRETLELADGILAELREVDAVPAPPALPDREQSLAAMRTAMLGHPGIAAGVFIGGMNGVVDELALFRHLHADLPVYAFASPGGAARDLFEDRSLGYAEDTLCGGPHAPIPPALLREPVAGYTRVARRIFDAIASVHARHPERGARDDE